jgi:hypothetical protein
LSGPLAANAGAVDIDRAHMMRPGKDVTLLSYGGSRGKTLAAAQALATDGIDAEVIDLRSLRPWMKRPSWPWSRAPAARWWWTRAGAPAPSPLRSRRGSWSSASDA